MHEYAVVQTPSGKHVAMARREVRRGDRVAAWASTQSRADERAKELNAENSEAIAEFERRQGQLFPDDEL